MKFKKLLMAAGVIGVLIASGAGANWYWSPIEVAKRDVKKSLRDPASARFSNVELCDTGEEPFVTGFVRSKNAYGGFSDAQPFLTTFGSIIWTDIDRGPEYPNRAYYYSRSDMLRDLEDSAPCHEIYGRAITEHDRMQKADEALQHQGSIPDDMMMNDLLELEPSTKPDA